MIRLYPGGLYTKPWYMPKRIAEARINRAYDTHDFKGIDLSELIFEEEDEFTIIFEPDDEIKKRMLN